MIINNDPTEKEVLTRAQVELRKRNEFRNNHGILVNKAMMRDDIEVLKKGGTKKDLELASFMEAILEEEK